MSLRNYKTSKTLAVFALLAVFFFHGAIIYAVTYMSKNSNNEILVLEQSTITVHHMSLAGVDTANEITNQHDEKDNNIKPEEEKEEIEKQEKIEEEKPIVEEKKEIIATKEPTPDAPKILAQKKDNKKPQKKNKAVEKPKAQRQSKRVDNRVFNINDISILSRPSPNYPRSLMMRKVTGTTTLLVKINREGKVVSVKIEKSSGNDQIDKAAVIAAQKVRLKPYIVDGEAQEIVVRILYELKN